LTRKVNIFESIDWITISLFLVLVIFGWMNIFAVNYNEKFRTIFDINQEYGRQLIWILLSFIAVSSLFVVDYKSFRFFAYALYVGVIFLLIAVLVFGTLTHGSKSWINLFGLNFQPSEFAKIATALAIARYLSAYNVKIKSFKSIFLLLAFIFIPAILIFLQPDWGTSIIFCFFFIVLFREGLPGWILILGAVTVALFIASLMFPRLYIVIGLILLAQVVYMAVNKRIKHSIVTILLLLVLYFIIKLINVYFGYGRSEYVVLLAALVVSSLISLVLALRYKIRNVVFILFVLFSFIAFTYSVDYVFHNVLKPHQQKRVNILLGKEVDPRGYGYNVNQSKIAIGSGGFVGMGFLKGTQTKLDFVPEQSTDFIFCTIGEEWGFIGTTIVVILFALLLSRIIILAERQRSAFSRIYGYGVASMIFAHFAINIGMTIGLSPVIGIPLPFLSYGGSSVLAFSILLFILVRLDASRMAYLK
jgi:rod shape determining protein RodA